VWSTTETRPGGFTYTFELYARYDADTGVYCNTAYERVNVHLTQPDLGWVWTLDNGWYPNGNFLNHASKEIVYGVKPFTSLPYDLAVQSPPFILYAGGYVDIEIHLYNGTHTPIGGTPFGERLPMVP